MSKFNNVKVLESKIIYDRHNRRVVVDEVEFADRSKHDYVYFKNGSAVCVLACTKDKKIILAKQYRHPMREIFLNLPGGAAEEGESVLEAARREFEEETGFTVGKLERIGSYSPGPNSNVVVDLFFTSDFEQKGKFDSNETISIEYVDFKIMLQRVLSGECFDSALSIAVMLAALKNLILIKHPLLPKTSKRVVNLPTKNPTRLT